jgi:hypothetical protein
MEDVTKIVIGGLILFPDEVDVFLKLTEKDMASS